MKSIHENCEKTFGKLPEKVLQFGEGNFLRAFVDWMIELSNRQGEFNGSIVICQPIANGLADMLNKQNCQYTVLMRGIKNGVPIEVTEHISSVSRCINPYKDYSELLAVAHNDKLCCIVSNTTEAGIAYHAGDKIDSCPPDSYPAKLCAFLYERFKSFQGAADKGLLILPVELIDNNGHELKRIVLQYAKEWQLGSIFTEWLNSACEFASTLVDRIVTGYPRDQIDEIQNKLGYTDNALDTCEVFNLWVIEADKKWSKVFPIHTTDANIIWTNDVTPYKKRKVRILNGAHTSTVLAAYLSGHDIVLEFMNDPVIRQYMNELLLDEVVPTLDLPKEELVAFVNAVNDRFSNPFIRHRLLDISLNSCSKFNARCLPSLLAYQKQFGKIPTHLAFALAAFLLFYRGVYREGHYWGTREDGTQYEIRDDQKVLEFFAETWTKDTTAVVHAALSNTDFWSARDLTQVEGLEQCVAGYLNDMLQYGVKATVQSLLYV